MTLFAVIVSDVGGKNVLVQAMVIEMEGGARKVELDLTGGMYMYIIILSTCNVGGIR